MDASAPDMVKALSRLGYAILPRDMVPYGCNVFWDIDRLSKLWKVPVDVFFDVGANTGETAKNAMNELPTARVFAFEPHPTTYRSLIEAIPQSERFRAYNTALSTTVGNTEMFEYDMPEINSMVENAPFAVRYQKQGRSLAIKSTTVDAFCQEHGIASIDVLKVDTEGFDLAVLMGAKAMLKEGRIRFVFAEFNDIKPRAGISGGSLLALDDALHSYGYRFIASYTDWMDSSGELFLVCNALFALPPSC